jgi:hypothetical protein
MFGPSTSANFGNSTIDWGFLGALAGRKNFDALKQEKLREVALVDQQNNILQNRVAQNEAAQQGISQYLDTINQLKVLPQGLERIKEVDKSLRENITKGIMDSKGDVRKWLMSGGTKVLNEYKNNLVNNEVTQREIGNAYQTNKWLADKQAGLQEEYSFDEKGTPITFQDQYQKYQDGKIDKLDYKGAFKLPEYKSTIPDRYAYMDKEKAKWADEKDVFNDAYQQFKDLPENQRKQAAWHHTMDYVKRVQSGAAPYQFKHDQRDPLKDELDRSRIAKNYSGVAKDRAAIGALQQQQASFLASWNKGEIRPNATETIVDQNGKAIGKIPYMQLDNNTFGNWASLSGIEMKDGEATNSGKSAIKNMELYDMTGKVINLSNAQEGGIQKVQLADSRAYKLGNDPRPFVKMYVHLDEKNGMEHVQYDGKKMEQENIFTSVNNLPIGSDYKDDKFFGFNDKRGVVQVMVPLNSTPMSLHQEKKQNDYFTKAKDGFASENIGSSIMQGLMQIDNAE